MRGLFLAVLLLLVATCAAALWWSGAMAEPTPTDQFVPATQRDGAAAADATAQRGDAGPSDASAAGQDLQRRAEQPSGARSFPERAAWLELTVVDRDDHPIAGAEVGWFHDTEAWQLQDRIEDERQRIAWIEEPLLLADAAGWRATTGDDGKVRVAVFDETTVVGRHEGRRGVLPLVPGALAPAGGFRLVLRDDDQIDVRVITAEGTPAQDVPVGLFCEMPDQDFVSYLGPSALAVTDADGRATITGLTPHRTELAGMMPDKLNRIVTVRPFVPGHGTAAQRVSLDPPPAETIVLKLPPCGSVRVRAEVTDTTSVPPHLVRLTYPQEQTFDGWASALIGDDGFARFDHVPVGTRLRLYVPEHAGLELEHDGPREAGEVLELTIAAPRDLVLIAGRLLDANGPLVDRHLQLSVSGDLYLSCEAQTDAAGRFVAAARQLGEEASLEVGTAQLIVHDGERMLGSASLPSMNLRAGVNALGDLKLIEPALLARGRLAEAGAAPRAGASTWPETQLMVEAFAPENDPDSPWTSHAWAVVDRETGMFELRGEQTSRRLRATVSSEGLLPSKPVEFQCGEQDLVLKVTRGYQLAASLLLQDARPQMMTCRLEPKVPDAQLDDRLWGWPRLEQGARHQLLWDSLPGGSYTLVIEVPGGTAARIPDIVLPQPAGGDPRLVDIDLRAALRKAQLRVTYDPGVETSYFLVSVRDDETGRATCNYGTSVLELLLPAHPVQAVIAAHGCRPREVRIDREDLEVRLDAWQPMVVRLVDAPEQAAKMSLSLALIGSDRDEVERRAAALGLDDDPGILSPSFHDWQFESGVANVRIGDGPHRVRLTAWANGKQFEFATPLPATLQPTTRPVTLQVPAEQWQLAIQHLGLDK